eukprot:1161838-Pelagomonas_calceolata.AAC.1
MQPVSGARIKRWTSYGAGPEPPTLLRNPHSLPARLQLCEAALVPFRAFVVGSANPMYIYCIFQLSLQGKCEMYTVEKTYHRAKIACFALCETARRMSGQERPARPRLASLSPLKALSWTAFPHDTEMPKCSVLWGNGCHARPAIAWQQQLQW